MSTETSYIIRVYVSDNGGTTYSSELSLGTIKYPIDVKAGGTGVAFGKVAERTGYVDFGWPIYCYDNTGKTCISRRGVSNTWVNGRNSAMIKMHSVDGYSCMASLKTVNGTWDIGTYSSYVDKLAFTYITDANYNSGNNTLTGQVIFNTDGSIDARVSKATNADYATSAGRASTAANADSASGLSNTYFRTTSGEWLGLYNSGGTRLAWFGNNGGNYTVLQSDLARSGASALQFRAGGYAAVSLDAYPSGSPYKGFFMPRNKNEVTLGTTTYRWYCAYLQINPNVESDRRMKDNISYFDEAPVVFDSNGDGTIYEKLFKRMRRSSFTLKEAKNSGLHFGYIAQDIVDAINDLGLSIDEVGFVTHGMDGENNNGEEPTYALCYEQFIALNTYMIQMCLSKIDAQNVEIQKLKNNFNKN